MGAKGSRVYITSGPIWEMCSCTCMWVSEGEEKCAPAHKCEADSVCKGRE